MPLVLRLLYTTSRQRIPLPCQVEPHLSSSGANFNSCGDPGRVLDVVLTCKLLSARPDVVTVDATVHACSSCAPRGVGL
jgi:hypothetical protein